MKRLFRAGFVLLGLLALLPLGRAAIAQDDARVVYTETPIMGGYRYDFTFYNDLLSADFAGFNLYDVSFFFDPGPEVTVESMATGWDNSAAPDALIFFASFVGEPPVGSEIAPGTSLGGFRIRTGERFNDRTFVATFVNPEDPDAPRQFVGITQEIRGSGQTAPEPATLALLTSVTFAFLGKTRFRPRAC